jgi:hypothetical protein
MSTEDRDRAIAIGVDELEREVLEDLVKGLFLRSTSEAGAQEEEVAAAALERPNHRLPPPLCSTGGVATILHPPLTTTVGRQGEGLQESTKRQQRVKNLNLPISAATTAGQRKEGHCNAPPQLPSPPLPAGGGRASQLEQVTTLISETADLHSNDASDHRRRRRRGRNPRGGRSSRSDPELSSKLWP